MSRLTKRSSGSPQRFSGTFGRSHLTVSRTSRTRRSDWRSDMRENRAKLKAEIKELRAELEKLNDRFEEEVGRAAQEQISDIIALYRKDAQRFDKVAEALGISPQAGGETAVAKIRALHDDIEELADALREAEKENLRLKRKYLKQSAPNSVQDLELARRIFNVEEK